MEPNKPNNLKPSTARYTLLVLVGQSSQTLCNATMFRSFVSNKNIYTWQMKRFVLFVLN